MFRYYIVPVYELEDNLESYQFLDYIVASSYCLFAKELLTGYYSIEILNKTMVENNKLKLISCNTLATKKANKDVALFTFKEDFIPKNLVTEDYLDYYVSNFDNSKFNVAYKKVEARKIRKVHSKIKKLKNIKK